MKDPFNATGARCQCGGESRFILRSQDGTILSAPCTAHLGRATAIHALTLKDSALLVYEAAK